MASSGSHPALLTGLLFDGDGQRLTPTHARKGATRYHYYVSARLVTGARTKTTKAAHGLGLSASDLDALVTRSLHDID